METSATIGYISDEPLAFSLTHLIDGAGVISLQDESAATSPDGTIHGGKTVEPHAVIHAHC
jgi:hypothetical protein